MPKAWSGKDEEQYENIKRTQLQRGASKSRAKEVAAATVNKQRRWEGRTPNETTEGSGNPNSTLEQRTRKQLYNRARELNIRGRSNMTKSQLISAIRSR